MATNYPSGVDSFDVPGSPGTTPLSSAGTSARNHVTSHRDLGDAVVALQQNATKSTHTHDNTGINGPKLAQANTHQTPDTDAATSSLHHTLGTSATQAAAGNHNHDSSYVGFAGNQTITGQKTFPSGSNQIIIPDFSGSQHNHLNAANGGMAVGSKISSALGQGAHPSTVGANTTVAFPLTNPFILPANMGLAGSVTAQWIWNHTGDFQYQADTLWYPGFQLSPYSGAVYSAANNIYIGVGDHGRNSQLIAASSMSADTYSNMVMLIYVPPATLDRAMRLTFQVVNYDIGIRSIGFASFCTFTN